MRGDGDQRGTGHGVRPGRRWPWTPAVRVAIPGVVSILLIVAGGASAQPAAEEAGDVRAWEEAVRHYLEVGREYRLDLDSVFQRAVERRRRAVEEAYSRDSAGIEKELRVRRDEAIRVLETFLSRYPDHNRYTPEVMFRLAELYFEKAQDDYYVALPEYEERRALWERGKVAEEPVEPEKDYSRAIALYDGLLSRFPQYALADAARYALAFCLEEAGELERGVAVLQDLVRTQPDSPWVPEAWLRIGEYYFDIGRYDASIEAYEHALVKKDSKYYEMALYKLAWSYFQKYDYPSAIRLFKTLITHIDEAKGELGLGAQLRSEAVEYLGVSLADDDWNGDGVPDPDATVSRAVSYLSDGKPYEREVLERYADTLYAQHEAAKYPMAVEAYRAVIARDPMHPGNVAVKEKVIAVFDAMRDVEKMIAERQDMVRQFGPGSAWYEANKARPEVIARVDRQVELALEQAAKFHHKRAQDFKAQAAASKDPSFGAASLKEYREAAAAYAEYLRQFPQTKEAYELTYYHADCLYYSFEFEAAVREYEKVRDWPGRTEYLEPAAYAVIDSLEKEAAKRVTEGRMPADEVPGEIQEVREEETREGEGKVAVTPRPIPRLTQLWMAAVDAYLARGLTRQNDPELPARLAYRVANEYYKYLNLDEARRRFLAIIEKYPQDLVASYAAINVINSYRIENDWENIQVWAKKIEELQLGKPEQRAQLQEEVRLFQLGAQFKEAERLFEAGEYVQAAEAFVVLVDRDPKNKFADRALQNAAIGYQKARRYDSAARIYQRIVSDYPDSPYVEGALLQLAENAKKFYDFDRAVRSYQALRARFPKSQYAAYALLTAGVLLEAEGRLDEAARSCEEFARAYPTDAEAGPSLVRAARMHERLARPDDVIRVTQWFVNQYGNDPKLSEQVVESLARVADIYHVQGNRREWEKVARTVIQWFENRGLPPDTPVAAHPARLQFLMVEPLFQEYEKILFTGSLNEQGRKLKRKDAMLKQLEEEYSKVLPYKAMEWTSAAFFRMARIHEVFADALFSAEIPTMSQEEMDIYQTQIEDAAQGYLDRAQERYMKLIEEARRLKIANEWVNRAREAMNKYRPQEFPLFKEERRAMDYRVRAIPSFLEAL